jgi:uncharacterized membrane protein
LAFAVGYGAGVLGVWVWRYLELPKPNATLDRVSKQMTAVGVAILMAGFLWRAAVWQNSIRALMEMEPVATAYPWRVAGIAFVTSVLLVAAVRGLAGCWRYVHRQISAHVPRRVSYVVSTLAVMVLLFLLANHLVARLLLNAADAVFLQMDELADLETSQPSDPLASGSAESLIPWDTIGRQGKRFIAHGPTRQEISQFWGKDALQPLRVYVGKRTSNSLQEGAALALEELKRVGGFSRSVLVVATPTGTGWLDPGGVDTLEYLHAGDTAIVSVQYSHLPSWITILVDPERSRNAAKVLFDEIYGHWTTLPREKRPKLFLHGLSLGALGSEVSADLFTIFEDPIQGGVWSGPPFPSTAWARATRARNPDSPMWLPTFRDSSLLRFTGRQSSLADGDQRWGPMRFVYIQQASDPMCFFSPDLLYRKPDWLAGPRGPDVSPYLQWFPVVTFLQIAFDLPMATSVPTGYGHNYAPSSYLDAWIAVSQPPGWSEEDTFRLNRLLAGKGGAQSPSESKRPRESTLTTTNPRAANFWARPAPPLLLNGVCHRIAGKRSSSRGRKMSSINRIPSRIGARWSRSSRTSYLAGEISPTCKTGGRVSAEPTRTSNTRTKAIDHFMASGSRFAVDGGGRRCQYAPRWCAPVGSSYNAAVRKPEREVNDGTDHEQTSKVRLLKPHDVRDLRTGQVLKCEADGTVAVKLGPGDGTLLEEVP